MFCFVFLSWELVPEFFSGRKQNFSVYNSFLENTIVALERWVRAIGTDICRYPGRGGKVLPTPSQVRNAWRPGLVTEAGQNSVLLVFHKLLFFQILRQYGPHSGLQISVRVWNGHQLEGWISWKVFMSHRRKMSMWFRTDIRIYI